MAESDLHLKLDRILAGQASQQQAIAGLDNSVTSLAAGLSVLSDDLATQREILAKLVEAMSKEQEGGEMRELLMRIEALLGQVAADGTQMVEVLNTLPNVISSAAIAGIQLVLSDSVDRPLREPPM